jgi:hypothetical protein
VRTHRRRSRWRPVVAAALLTTAAVLVPVSAVTAWARVHVVDENAFVATFAPLAGDPAVQDAVIHETTRAIAARVDFDELTRQLVDGLVDLGLGSRSAAVLRLLEERAAAGLRGATEDAVDAVVRSPEFASLWSSAVRATHRAVTTAATIDGRDVVALTDRGVVVRLGPLVDRVRERIGGISESAGSLIPSLDREIVVAPGAGLAQTRAAYSAVVAAGWWTPLLTVALLGAAVIAARRRIPAVLGVGIAIVVGAILLWITLAIGGSVLTSTAGGAGPWTAAIESAYDRVVDPLEVTARIVAVTGVAVAVGAIGVQWLIRRAASRPGDAGGDAAPGS